MVRNGMSNAKGIYDRLAGKALPLRGSGEVWELIKERYKKFEVLYDCFGFPDFFPFVLNEYAGKSFPPETFIVDLTKYGGMTGCQKDTPSCVDFSKANQEVVERLRKGGVTISDGASFVDAPIDGIKYTWHHHQDGKHMMLVPSYVNNSAVGGAAHIGGAKLVKEHSLVGYFDDPFTANHKIAEPCN